MRINLQMMIRATTMLPVRPTMKMTMQARSMIPWVRGRKIKAWLSGPQLKYKTSSLCNFFTLILTLLPTGLQIPILFYMHQKLCLTSQNYKKNMSNIMEKWPRNQILIICVNILTLHLTYCILNIVSYTLNSTICILRIVPYMVSLTHCINLCFKNL